MNVSQRFKNFVDECRNEYCKEFTEIPNIEDVQFGKLNNVYAYFLKEDLRNKKYILYISFDIIELPNISIKSILFHEFTHVADSLSFGEYNDEDFADIMFTYSEMHGSEIEMEKTISVLNQINPRATICHGEGLLTIDSFIKQSFNHVKNAFIEIQKSKCSDDFYDISNLFYHIGYLKALRKYNVNYNFKFYEIVQDFMIHTYDLSEALLKDNVDYRYVIKLYRNLNDSIIRTIRLNEAGFNNL